MLKDTIMWVTGIVIAVLAAGLMVWSDIDDGPLLVLGMLGILFIAVGARRRRSQPTRCLRCTGTKQPYQERLQT